MLKVEVKVQPAPEDVRFIYATSALKDYLAPKPRSIEVVCREYGRIVVGVRGWIGLGWLHLDAIVVSSERALPCAIAAVESAAFWHMCRRSQAETCFPAMRLLLERCGYIEKDASKGYHDEWAILHKDLRSCTDQSIGLVIAALRESSGTISEAESADLMNLSPSRFRHRFKTALGISFREARVQARLIQITHFLKNTAFDIPEIAELVEYADRTKLEKSFKKFFGVTPARYRKDLSNW